VAAVCTNPLDVINTRIKAGSLAGESASMLQVTRPAPSSGSIQGWRACVHLPSQVALPVGRHQLLTTSRLGLVSGGRPPRLPGKEIQTAVQRPHPKLRLRKPRDVPGDGVVRKAASTHVQFLYYFQVGRSVAAKEGMRALFTGLAPRVLIMGGGSTVFWTVHASTKSWMERGHTPGL